MHTGEYAKFETIRNMFCGPYTKLPIMKYNPLPILTFLNSVFFMCTVTPMIVPLDNGITCRNVGRTLIVS